MEVLSESDEIALEHIRDQGNTIAHNLPRVIFGDEPQIDLELLNACRELVIRIGRFWARLDLETDPEFDGRDIADKDFRPGMGIMLEYIAKAAADAIAPNT